MGFLIDIEKSDWKNKIYIKYEIERLLINRRIAIYSWRNFQTSPSSRVRQKLAEIAQKLPPPTPGHGPWKVGAFQ